MRILIIQQKKIGDVLTSTILCNNLKKKYPDAVIDYMCYPNCVAVLIENPSIDNIITLSDETRKSYVSLFRFIFKIRNKKYDYLIDVYNKLESNLITLFSGAKHKISYHKWYSSIFYNHNLKRFYGIKTDSGLAIENRLLLLKPLIEERTKDIRPRIYLTNKEINTARKSLHKHQINLGERSLIMFNILGSEKYKTYPLEKMAKIIDFTILKTNAKILFNYIPNQTEEALEVYSYCSDKSKQNIYFDLYGESLRSFIALLSLCDMVIGNEGGAINMGKAVNIPTFSLFSPSVDEGWQLFENEKDHVSIHLKDLKPEIYEQHDEKYIRKNTFKFYDQYPFELILEKLEIHLKELNMII